MPLDTISAASAASAEDAATEIALLEGRPWTISLDARNKELFDSADPIIVQVVSQACGKRLDRGPVPLVTLVKKRADIRAFATNYRDMPHYLNQLLALADFLDSRTSGDVDELTRKIMERIAGGVVTFTDLPSLIPAGTRIISTSNGMQTGAIVTSSRIESYSSAFGGRHRYFEMTVRQHAHSHKGLHPVETCIYLGDFRGIMAIGSLDVRPASEEEIAALAERGRKVREVASGSSHVEYEGTMIAVQGWRTVQRPATGRVMIDAATLEHASPDNYSSLAGMLRVPYNRHHAGQQQTGDGTNDSIPEDELFTVNPLVIGFSLACKSWGLFDVTRIKPAVYNKEAFDLLVQDADTKGLLRSVIRSSGAGFTDIIRGKGGGTTILLHGSAGVGKTLTAEAVSDLLERPLYSIAVGELGSTPEQLEKGLSTVLGYASAWNAVLLLDEADIYMERRDSNNIARNAMVAIFLRLLEYYNGVLILTTNRVKEFDEAFHSRIALAIHYPGLDEDSRLAVWGNLLTAAGLTHIDPASFAEFDLNGRQIKNTIRMAMNLAADQDVPVGPEHISQVLRVILRFRQDLEDARKA